jgi:O-antigen/teichoic acid export membrane protein
MTDPAVHAPVDDTPPTATPARGVLANATALIGGELGSRVFAFAAAAYLSRRLGVAGFGVVGFALAFTGYFGLVVRGGVPRLAAREVARAPDRAPELAVTLALVCAAIALVVYVALWIVVGTLALTPPDRTLLRVTGLLLLPIALDVSWAWKGLGRSAPVGIALVAGQVLSLGVLLLVVHGPADVVRVPVAQLVGQMLVALSLLLPLLLRSRGWVFGAASRLMRAAMVPAVTSFVRALVFTFDVVLLGLLDRRADLGAYTAAYRVCFLVLAIAVALHASFWPAAALAERPRALGVVVDRALSLATAAGLPLVVGGIVLAAPLMRLLFGADFATGAPMLQWLLVSIGFALAHGAFTTALLASGATRRELAIMIVAATVNVAGDLAVIPKHGARGASIVTAVSEGVALLLCVAAGRRAGWHVGGRGVIAPLTASAVMAAVLVLVGNAVPVLARVLLGGVVYVAALCVLGLPAEVLPHVRRVRREVERFVARRA